MSSIFRKDPSDESEAMAHRLLLLLLLLLLGRNMSLIISITFKSVTNRLNSLLDLHRINKFNKWTRRRNQKKRKKRILAET